MRKAYSSDLTDSQWTSLEPLIPLAKTKPRRTDMREIFNGIFYVLKSGCQWHMLPGDFPFYGTCFYYFNKFRKDGTFEAISKTLTIDYRQSIGKNAKASAGIIDSQSVKSSEVGGVRGYDAGKKNQRAQAVFTS